MKRSKRLFHLPELRFFWFCFKLHVFSLKPIAGSNYEKDGNPQAEAGQDTTSLSNRADAFLMES